MCYAPWVLVSVSNRLGKKQLTPEILSPFLYILFWEWSLISWCLLYSFSSRFSLQNIFNWRVLQILDSWHLHWILTDLSASSLRSLTLDGNVRGELLDLPWRDLILPWLCVTSSHLFLHLPSHDALLDAYRLFCFGLTLSTSHGSII